MTLQGIKSGGISVAAKAWLLYQKLGEQKHLAYLVPDNKHLEGLCSDLQFFCPPEQIVPIPDWGTLPFEHVSPPLGLTALRIKSFCRLLNEPRWLTLLSVEALSQLILPPQKLLTLRFTLREGQEIEREQLLLDLELCGFDFRSRIQTMGDMAVRGEVIDIFPSTTTNPVRLEFFDNVIERIKIFSAESQRSLSTIDHLEILPLQENIRYSLHPRFEKALSQGTSRLETRGQELGVPLRVIKELKQLVIEGGHFQGTEKLSSLFYELAPIDTLWGSHSPLIFTDDPVRCSLALDKLYEEIETRADRYHREQTFFVEPRDLYRPYEEAKKIVESATPLYGDFGSQNSEIQYITPNSELVYGIKHKGSQKGFQPLADFIRQKLDSATRVAIAVPTQSRTQQVVRILQNLDLAPSLFSGTFTEWLNLPHTRSSLTILEGSLSHGFHNKKDNFAIIAEEDIFASRSSRSSRPIASHRKILSTLGQLSQDEFIVHLDYGIGRYKGLTHRTIDEIEGDFLEIEYADSTLLLPVQMIGKVSRFSAPTDQPPKLDKLSSTRWIQTKLKVKEAVITLAGDLIKLYASRAVARGWRFDVIGAEDERFAESFPYDETPDQLKAIEDTLTDMASESPMDRLICGDVGFGKTEVALRAAFKATQHLKQVAVLAPTTVLAEQHARTFRDRFKEFSVKVGVVSRFYSSNENRDTLRALARGEIDIIVGTHRLLSQDIAFYDLGLLIIDEEHRFGVKQKERIKSFKTQIDVLTLTATPIPRTLHMSLIGVRDVSIIASPPPRRQVIKTFVARAEESIIKDAITRELQRGGQVFFIYNRVQSIGTMVAKVKELLPESKIAYGHGQMKEAQLDDIMRQFIEGETEVLVSTTIVESGIDVPNANTIIIYDAQNYGLAQLYQLRGRVGRGDRQAYAYFLTPPPHSLTPVARERLSVFSSMNELGVGFELAMRDLEIRGSGNLLGKEQSGHVVSVGFDLYTKILKQAIEHLKGGDPEDFESIDPEVNLGIVAFIPGFYVPDVSERLILYQRLASLSSKEEGLNLVEEMEDRFGPLPEEALRLVNVMNIRALLRVFGVIKLDRKDGRNVVLKLSSNAPFDIQEILTLCSKDIKFSRNLSLTCIEWLPAGPDIDLEDLFEKLEGLLARITRKT
jgi:transcription-repair coupling factor (superfamily II helicase)